MTRTRSTGAAVLAVALLLAGCGPPDDHPPPPPPHEPIPATPALQPGAALPPIPAEGWINGPPRVPTSPGVHLLVVDVWAAWCPFCRMGAPGLVRLYRKYADQGVAFVSVTTMNREAAEAFAQEFAVPWPSGYGLTREGVMALGAGSGQPTAGYEVAPVLYLVGSDGRVRWGDNQDRLHHLSPEQWERELDAAISTALAGP